MARPRDPKIDEAVGTVTRALLAEVGFEALTIDAVAARAGVSRPSIYRRWSSKAELVLSAVIDNADIGRGAPTGLAARAPDTGTLRGDLLALTDRLVSGFDRMAAQGLLAGIAAHMAVDPAFADQLRTRLLDPDQAQLAVVFDRAVARDELGTPTDGAPVLEILAGAVFYRQVLLHQACPRSWRRFLVDLLIDGAGRDRQPP